MFYLRCTAFSAGDRKPNLNIIALCNLEDKMLLEGKNAIVTGGSQGIGTAASL
jgi:hypothetical protein